MAKLLTALFSFRLAAWEELRGEGQALTAARERLLARQGLMPEEQADEEAFFRETIQLGRYYEGLTARRMRKLDRYVIDVVKHELALVPLLPDASAHRYEWIDAFMDRLRVGGPLRAVFLHLVQGRRFGRSSQVPEDLPYYAYLAAAEAAFLAAGLPAVLDAMKDERARGSRRFWQRRGYAHDQPYELLDRLVPALGSAVDRGGDIFAVTF